MLVIDEMLVLVLVLSVGSRYVIFTNALTRILAATAQPVTTKVSLVCPKCGTIENSGRLSCCVRGGAWFDDCGDPGDSKFGHTWLEGMRACKGICAS